MGTKPFEEAQVCLVHHSAGKQEGAISPFHAAIEGIVDKADLRIVCPYLYIPFLLEMTQRARSWRLLTDVEEWVRSLSMNHRASLQWLIRDKRELIHHVADLHAKVLMNDTIALVGSANFTKTGLAAREEVSVLIRGEPTLRRLHEWFDELWEQSAAIDADELRAFVEGLPRTVDAPSISAPRVSSAVRRPRTRLPWLENRTATSPRPPAVAQDIYERLLKTLRRSPGRDWINGYFDLVAELITTTGLSCEDPRLTMSIRTDYRLPVTINHRYVLTYLWHGSSTLGFSFPKNYVLPELLEQRVVKRDGDFAVAGQETFETVPRVTYIRFDHPSDVPPELKQVWRHVLSRDVHRPQKKSTRKYHQPVIYDMAVNPVVRNLVFDQAFGG